MKAEDALTVYEKLIGKYQCQIQIEISLRHFKKAQELLDAIKNIIQLLQSKYAIKKICLLVIPGLEWEKMQQMLRIVIMLVLMMVIE